MSQPTRMYTLPTLTLEWRQELCIHCGNCHTGLPNVFDPAKRPWVDLTKATPEQIREQVGQCPSGALVVGS